MAGVAMTFTEVPGARTVDEFFVGLRARCGRVRGAEGSFAKLTADVFRIGKSTFQEKPATLALLPFAVFIPLFTAGHWANELRFCRKWAAHFQDEQKSPRMLWDLSGEAERV
jgi:hypothetical protein